MEEGRRRVEIKAPGYVRTAMKKNNRVLFFYPNSEGYGGIPNTIAILSASLKGAGFQTRCFDTTFLNSPPKAHFTREKHGGVMSADHTKTWGEWSPDLPKKIPELFINTIKEFDPALIAVTIAEVNYTYAISLLKQIKKAFNIPVIAGGITVTMSPEMVIANDCVDMICIGEGEDALVELAQCIADEKDPGSIRNLWVKKDGAIIKNPLRPFKDMDTLLFQDWSIFDERHVYKPYCSVFRRTGFFELARGCHFNCSFCCTANLRKIYQGLGDYIRNRNIDKAFDEIVEIKKKYGLELIFFIDDNFLGMPRERFDYFCDQYKKRIGLPFYLQTRSETVKDDYIKRLKEINVSTIAIGVEHGDEGLRKEFLNRRMNNDNLQRAFDIVHKYDIRTTANIIIGLPGEREEMFRKTIDLLRKLQPRSISINYFAPFRGTLLREKAVELGYIPADHIICDSTTCLDMPQFRRDRIIHYYENFTKYLEGELALRVEN